MREKLRLAEYVNGDGRKRTLVTDEPIPEPRPRREMKQALAMLTEPARRACAGDAEAMRGIERAEAFLLALIQRQRI